MSENPDYDGPVTLAEACRLFFGGRLTPSALRTEAAKGNLIIMQIARKDFVTRQAIDEMKERCRRPISGLNPVPATASDRPGRSPTPSMSAQDALTIKLRMRAATQVKNGRLP